MDFLVSWRWEVSGGLQSAETVDNKNLLTIGGEPREVPNHQSKPHKKEKTDMGMIKEFKEFAMKGNVMDLAVAVIIGTAFGAIVTALVANILTPLIGMVSGGINLSGLKVTVGSAELTYGVFVQAVIDFVIVAFCIFMIIKMMNKAQAAVSGPADEPEPEKTPEDIELLREIRDSLKK